MGKPVAATCDAHYLNEEDYIYRNIIMAAHGFKELDEEPSLYLKTTDEMLEEFALSGGRGGETRRHRRSAGHRRHDRRQCPADFR